MATALASRPDVEATTAAPLAALLAALFDGVILHRMVDADLDVTGWVRRLGVAVPRSRSRDRTAR